ncbi:MAG: hypothetical protein NT166_26795 [Candidatus Aminicenantes bacterium]|nr:hypothetical protein [Candidatus Aminicenantes bacterium]
MRNGAASHTFRLVDHGFTRKDLLGFIGRPPFRQCLWHDRRGKIKKDKER